MKHKKYYTTKEWSKFKKNNYFDMQELLCEKYDVILTDYKTKRQVVFSYERKTRLGSSRHWKPGRAQGGAPREPLVHHALASEASGPLRSGLGTCRGLP